MVWSLSQRMGMAMLRFWGGNVQAGLLLDGFLILLAFRAKFSLFTFHPSQFAE